ncbi:hypothetical protein [Sanguibacter sp. 25GB23B1]|uniref:hypothetical protein n=1 Tax=unclassified Sanguibacter TaxID=2645534 RepID=UPI0032AF2B1B
MLTLRKRLASLALAGALAGGGLIAAGGPASASPASSAFNACVTPYVNLAAKQSKAEYRDAIQYVGYTNCYYDLSQRSDITPQQEITAINNYYTYRAKAVGSVAKVSIKIAVQNILAKNSLRGLKL